MQNVFVPVAQVKTRVHSGFIVDIIVREGAHLRGVFASAKDADKAFTTCAVANMTGVHGYHISGGECIGAYQYNRDGRVRPLLLYRVPYDPVEQAIHYQLGCDTNILRSGNSLIKRAITWLGFNKEDEDTPALKFARTRAAKYLQEIRRENCYPSVYCPPVVIWDKISRAGYDGFGYRYNERLLLQQLTYEALLMKAEECKSDGIYFDYASFDEAVMAVLPRPSHSPYHYDQDNQRAIGRKGADMKRCSQWFKQGAC